MRKAVELQAGGTYVLDDFTVIQVVAVAESHVRYRARAWSWTWQRRIVTRRIPPSRLKGRIRAQVNGDFFPDVALPDLHRFERPAAEVARLEAHLAERAKRRPFADGA